VPETTLTEQIAADLRSRITSGGLPPGATLPSENDLGLQYGTSRVTVRRALEDLEQEGLVTARPGIGRVVRTRRNMVHRPQRESEPRRSTTMDRFMTSLVEDGRNPSQTIEITVEGASGIVADRYGVAEGTPLVVRKRVRSIDGEPFSISDTYYLHSVAKDTAVMDPGDIPQGSNSIIRAIVGPEVRAIDEFYIRMPTPDEVRRLRLPKGTPVAVHYSTGYTADDQVTRVEYFVLPGDRHVIVYERTHTPPKL
jgi:DNA-binding GntR family transcriptional regulator